MNKGDVRGTEGCFVDIDGGCFSLSRYMIDKQQR